MMNKLFLNGIAAAMLPLGLCAPTTQAAGSYSYQGYRYARKSALPASIVSQPKVINTLPASMQQTPLAASDEVDLVEGQVVVQQLPKQSVHIEQNNELQILAGNMVRELIIIDSAVADKHLFYRQFKAGIDIKEINSNEDGLTQLSEIISHYHNLDALHIVSHATDGAIYLGNSSIDTERLKHEVSMLAELDKSLKDGADLMLYGCDLAKTEKGEQLLELIANHANIDVAASNDLTGNTERGGDWALEIHKGNIETEQPFSAVALQDFSSILGITGNSGIIDMSGFAPGGYTATKSYTTGGFTLKVTTTDSVSNAVGADTGFGLYINAYNDPTVTKADIYFTGGGTFDVSSMYIYNSSGLTQTFRLTSPEGDSQDSSALASAVSETVNLAGFTGISKLTITYAGGGGLDPFRIDDMVLASVSAGNTAPADISLTAHTINQSVTALGADVGTLDASDVDDSSFTFTLVSNGTAANGSCGAGNDTNNASFQINTATLETSGALAAGSYKVCLQADDGSNTFEKTHTIMVTDNVAPVFESSTPSLSAIGATGATLNVQLDEIGNAYWVVVADGAGAPSVGQVQAGQDSGGGAATASGNFSIGTASTNLIDIISGLTNSTAYDVFVVAEDDDGTPNVQASVTKVDFTTTDTAPIASSVSFSGTLQAGELLSSSYSYNDVDGDTESGTTFRWYASDNAGGSNKTTVSTTENFILTGAQVGKFISVEVTPVNANASGSAVESAINSSAVIAAEAAPTASGVSITDDNGGSVVVGDSLSGNYTYGDINGDSEGTSTFRWLKNGGAIAGATSSSYTLVAADSGTNITFEVTPVAASGTTTGSAVTSSGLTVTNTVPTASSVSISDDNGGSVVIGDILSGNYTFNDSDGDSEGLSTFRWLRNGAAIAGATSNSYTLVAVDSGNTITFEVTPVAAAGITTGSAVASTGVYINGQASISISGTAVEGQVLTAAVSDEDGVSAAIVYQWQAGGTDVGSDSETYTLSLADVGETITVRAIYTDDASTTEDVTSVATEVILSLAEVAITTIAEHSNGRGGDTPTLTDYNNAGVTAVTERIVGLVSRAVENTVTADADEVGEIQAIVAIVLAGQDSDHDGLPNFMDGDENTDTDGDSIADNVDGDSDNDGISDVLELRLDLTDTDADGIIDLFDADVDADGVIEADKLDNNLDGVNDAAAALLDKTDTDGDGILDVFDADVDGDDLLDTGKIDANADGQIDNLLPLAAINLDVDGDGIANHYDLDSDNDSILDVIEGGGVDADGNGLLDETATAAETLADTDADQLPDFLDGQSDGLTNDIIVAGLSHLDADDDGMLDAILDADKDGIADVIDGALGKFGTLADADDVHASKDVSVNSGNDYKSSKGGIGMVTPVGILALMALLCRLRLRRMGLMLALLLGFSQAQAGEWDVGLSAGNAFFDPELITGLKLTQDSDVAIQISLAYVYDKEWALELRYADLGESEVNSMANVEYSVAAVNAKYSFPQWPVENVSFYILAGIGVIDTEGSDGLNVEDDSPLEAQFGAGVSYAIKSWSINAELNSYNSNVSAAMLGMHYRF